MTLLALSAAQASAVTVTATFDNLSANNGFNNNIGGSYQSGDFRFISSGIFHYGRTHPDYPGSGAIYSQGSDPITVARANGQAFNFYAADFEGRDLGSAETVGITGFRADGSQISTTARLIAGVLVPQNFGFAGFTNLTLLRFTGGDQLDRLVFSDLVLPPVSDATVTFNTAVLGTVAGVYGEAGYLLASSPAGGLAVQSTMNDSHGLGVAGAGTIDLSFVGDLFSLRGFEIHGNLGEQGSFRLTVTDANGIDHASSTFALGTYNEAALLEMFGGQPFSNQITRARFENLTGQGVVLDNIRAIPEPSTALLVALGALLTGARNSFRPNQKSPRKIDLPLRNSIGILGLIVATLGFAALCDESKGEIINLNFDDIEATSNSLIQVVTPYNANGFTISTDATRLVTLGNTHIYWPGSAAVTIGNSQTLFVFQQNGQPFNFISAIFADRQVNDAKTVTLTGTKMNGATVTTSINLDGGSVSLQNFSFSTLTNLSSLQITGTSQWSDGTFEITPAAFSSVTANFDSAVPGPVGNSYMESNLTFTSPTAMSISSVLGARVLGGTASGIIVVTPSVPGSSLELTSFEIVSPEANGSYILAVSYEDGSIYTSSTLPGGIYDGTFLTFILNGRTGDITSLVFHTSEGSDPLWIDQLSADVVTAVSAPSIQVMLLPSGDYEISFTGILQSSPNLLPTSWQDITPQPTSPYVIPKANLGNRNFFRAREP